jgi:TolB-like protein
MSFVYKFEDYCLDSDRRELRRGADLVTVEPQVFDLLEYLIRNRDRIVGKDDLIAGVWNGRIVSDSTLSSRITATRQAIGDNGEQQRLIRTISRKGFRFVGVVSHTQETRDESIAKSALSAGYVSALPKSEVVPLPLPDKPSIAVLPFANLSGDPKQEYFVDGVIEEVITALSQFRWLFVIARSSSFIYKGRAIDVKQVGRELGVRYLIEGSVRKAGKQVRIAAQLIDTMSGSHLWADRFDGGLEDIFDLQNQVAASIVGAIGPKLEKAEIERAKRKPTESLDAYDFYLRAMASFHRMTKEGMDDALRLFQKAIELDAGFASAYGMAAYCYVWRKTNGWVTDRTHEIAETARLSRLAAEFGRDDAVALGTGGFALAHVVGDLEGGAAMIDQARALNPNLATLWLFSGWVKSYLSEPEIAIEHLARAMRLSPFDPQAFVTHLVIGFAHFIAERYNESAIWAERALQEQPNFAGSARVAAASNAFLGRTERAQMAMARLRQIDPSLRASNLKNVTPLRRPEDLARYAEGLKRAGLPE